MRNIIVLSKYFGKALLRERVIVVLVVLLPVLLITAGAASAPNTNVPLILDNFRIDPGPSAIELSVILYTITAVVLIASMVSFFLGFNLKDIIPRLKQMNYTTGEIASSFVLIMIAINLFMIVVVGSFSLFWIDVRNYFGFFSGLILATIIFSTLGLIIAQLVDTTTLGLYSILSLAVLDTAFLENPLYSRRYNDNWISVMPSHETIQMVLRTVYETGTQWTNELLFIILYELCLIIFYILISKYDIGFGKN